jgi:DNA (cytosine-5)-methyltransferase 1
MTLTIGSLFSGIGGLELGLEWAGLGPVVWQCEIDPFCRRVLEKHWPNVTRYEDVTRPRNYPHVDVICGGFPCQDVSSAGAKRGIGGQKSSLWWHYADIVRQVRPRFVVVENVASGQRLWLPHVRHQLHMLGYGTRAVALAASDVGAPHRRRRVFVVADAHGSRRQAGVARRGRQGRQYREGAEAIPDAAEVSSDALCGGALLERGRGEERSEAPDPVRGSGGGWREPEPDLVRVVHGLPRGLDGARRRALGNSVVPQCSEVIGRMILESSTEKGSADV